MATKIRFKGQEYILVEGALTTPEDFAGFEPSFAHLINGKVMRYGDVIGAECDIEYLGRTEAKVKSFDGLNSRGWFEKPKKV